MLIFVICVIFKCHFPPINTSKGISLFFKNFLPPFLINSWQFHMTKIFWGLKYSSLKMTMPHMRSLFTTWLKMIHFIRSVSDHYKCGIILKLLTVEVHSCVFCVIYQWLPWQREPKNNQKQRKNGHFCNFCVILKCNLPHQHTSGHQYGF